LYVLYCHNHVLEEWLVGLLEPPFTIARHAAWSDFVEASRSATCAIVAPGDLSDRETRRRLRRLAADPASWPLAIVARRTSDDETALKELGVEHPVWLEDGRDALGRGILKVLPREHRLVREAFSAHPPLERVQRYVSRHIDRPISLPEAAGVAALEPRYFSTFFREKTGSTFTEWLRRRRVARAMRLLGDRGFPVTLVAEKSGFGSVRTFQRAFRRVTGLTPSAYRRVFAHRSE